MTRSVDAAFRSSLHGLKQANHWLILLNIVIPEGVTNLGTFVVDIIGTLITACTHKKILANVSIQGFVHIHTGSVGCWCGNDVSWCDTRRHHCYNELSCSHGGGDG